MYNCINIPYYLVNTHNKSTKSRIVYQGLMYEVCII